LILALVTPARTDAITAAFGIAGDTGRWNENSRMTRDSMLKVGVKHLILPGDNLYSGTYDQAWSPWKQAGFTFDVVAIGNHNSGYANEARYFGMPGEFYSRTMQENSAKFIVLNSDNSGSWREQMAFLNQELSRATEPFVFLVYHHPTYTISTEHHWEEKREFQLGIREAIKRHRNKITALIIGHDHLASMLHFDDLPVILSGAAMKIRKDKPVNYLSSDGVRVTTSWFFDDQITWARLAIDTVTRQARVDFVRSKDSAVQCSVGLATGKPALMGQNCKIGQRNRRENF